MRMQSINLPWPPSVNTYWRMWKNRMLLSKKGREYRKAVISTVLNLKFATLKRDKVEPMTGRLRVTILVYPPDRRKRDLDNLPKGILDGLQHAGVYEDDSQIDQLLIKREAIEKGGRVHVQITEIPV